MVDRCVCHDVPFYRVLELRREGLSLNQIVEQTRCTTGCGLCASYVRQACKTGQCRLPVMSTAQSREIMKNWVDPLAGQPAREATGGAGVCGGRGS